MWYFRYTLSQANDAVGSLLEVRASLDGHTPKQMPHTSETLGAQLSKAGGTSCARNKSHRADMSTVINMLPGLGRN